MCAALAGLLLAGCADPDTDPAATGPTAVPGVAEEDVCEPGQLDGDVNLYMRSGSLDSSILDAFETNFDVEVLADSYEDDELVEPKLRSGAAYDVVATPAGLVDDLVGDGLVREMERSLIPNLGDIHPFFAPTRSDPGASYSAPFRWGALGIGVNTASVTPEPSWSALFDVALVGEYPAGVSLLEDARVTMAAALMSLGYSPNSADEEELGEAASLIAALGDAGAAFGSTDYVASLDQGEVDVALGSSEAFVDPTDNVAFSIPAEGSVVWIDSLVIPAASSHPCSAHTFIDFVLDDDQGPALTRWNLYASTRAGAGSYVESEGSDAGTPNPVANPAASFEILSDSEELVELYERYFATARQ